MGQNGREGLPAFWSRRWGQGQLRGSVFPPATQNPLMWVPKIRLMADLRTKPAEYKGPSHSKGNQIKLSQGERSGSSVKESAHRLHTLAHAHMCPASKVGAQTRQGAGEAAEGRSARVAAEQLWSWGTPTCAFAYVGHF